MQYIKMIEVLLVEDDLGDVELIKESLDTAKFKLELHHAGDGVEALDYLYKRGVYKKTKTPDLILLDLNLPRKDGREVLADIKKNDALKSIPVVVLTTSDAETDIVRSYNLGVNCYITKPINLESFIEVVQQIQEFWLSVVKLPTH